MNRYKWQGINLHGNECRGILPAQSPEELHNLLLRKHIVLISCHPHKNNSSLHLLITRWRVRTFSYDDLIFLFSSLSLLLNSGITLRDALHTITLQTPHLPHLKNLCSHAAHALEKGEMFSSFLEKELSSFPFIAPLIAVSEHTGKFSHSCTMIATYLEQQRSFRKKIQSAAMIPLITVSAALCMLLGMSIFIIPRFQMLYASFDKELPPFTTFIFSFIGFLSSKACLLIISVITVLLLFCKRKAPRMVQTSLHFFGTRIPIFKKLTWYQDRLYFFQTLHLLLHAGISLLSSLTISTKIVSKQFAPFIEEITALLSHGVPLSEGMKNAPTYFSPDQCALIALGERSDTLIPILKTVTDQVAMNYNRYLQTVITLFQPLLLITVGGIITAILIALYSPLLNLSSLI